MKIRELKIMDLGAEIIARDPASKIGQRCIYNPQQIGRVLLATIAMSNKSKDARRIAADLANRFF